jgi:hypothetical protein
MWVPGSIPLLLPILRLIVELSYQDGIVASILGALAVALWFLIFDAARGRPLYTPSTLGTARYRGPSCLTQRAAS